MLKVVLDTSILVSAFLKHGRVNAKILLGGKTSIHFIYQRIFGRRPVLFS